MALPPVLQPRLLQSAGHRASFFPRCLRSSAMPAEDPPSSISKLHDASISDLHSDLVRRPRTRFVVVLIKEETDTDTGTITAEQSTPPNSTAKPARSCRG